MKIVWSLLFASSLVLYALIFFGAASGGFNNPSVMYLIWLAVLAGLVCGVLTVTLFFTGKSFGAISPVLALAALWPLFWIGLAAIKAIIR